MYPSHSFVTIAMFSCLKTPFITEQCISQRDVHFIKLSQLMQREAQRSRRDQGQREVLLSPPRPLAPPSQSLSPGSWEVWGGLWGSCRDRLCPAAPLGLGRGLAGEALSWCDGSEPRTPHAFLQDPRAGKGAAGPQDGTRDT